MTSSTLMTEAPSPSAADASPTAPANGAAPASAPAAANPEAQTAAASTDSNAATDAAEQPAGDKPAGDTSDGEQKTDGDGDKPAGAPEKYEFTTPDGVTLDADLLGEFEGVARELNLPQDKAQMVVDKLAPKVAERMAAQQQAVVQQARADWLAASKSDKEFGGDKLAENMGVVSKAMSSFGTPELRALLDESGLGNHPEVIRAFYRAGKAISEDRIVTGNTGPASGMPKTDARSLYPNSNLN